MKLPWQKKEVDGKEEMEINFPDDQIKKIVSESVSASVDTIISAKLDEKLKDVTAFVSAQKKEKDDAAELARRKQATEHTEKTDAEIDDLMLTDPKKAIELATAGQRRVILQLRADGIRRELFQDNPDKFEYYTGEFKTEVDKLIAQQPVEHQNDPSVVENCYFTLLGRKQTEIKEGKLKSRFAQPQGGHGSNSGKTGDSAGGAGEALEINDDIRKAARIAGMTPEAYAKMCQEAGVGYV
jgi:hypothetical protein